MNFEAKKERAIAIMESKKMWRSNYAPPLLRLAWKAGLKVPPLPFASFWQITLLMGYGLVRHGGLYVVFFMEGQWYATGRCICLKHSRRYLLWCSYGCVSLVAKGS